MTETIRQCWAFHKHGSRCEHPAGHPGNHIVSKEWDDLDCATPGEFESEPGAYEKTRVAAPIETHERTIKCIACSHAHRNAECKCGCHEFIG